MEKILKRFDAHTKAIEGVTQQSVVGAVFTIIAAILVTGLLFSETYYFLNREVISRLEIDHSLGTESVVVKFDLEFFDVPCPQLKFQQEVTRGTEHSSSDGLTTFLPQEPQGCRVAGTVVTDKSAGYFQLGFPHSTLSPGIAPNLSHKIHELSIVSESNGMENAKQNPFVERNSNDQLAVGVHNYAITVVPTKYLASNGSIYYAHDYSVTERTVSKDYLQMGVTLSGVYFNDFFGIVFSYDFSPVMLVSEEQSESVIDFVTYLCGIIGGLLTIIGLFQRCVQSSTKALIGKKD